ncbi:34329_t:CDS:2, partial [Gigaspora margarita]
MPNIENLEKNNKFAKPIISAYREEILYRDDIKVSFGYALTGIAISLALAGVIYVVDKANTFILKIANQKYLSSYRTDKNGATYWKFKEIEENKLTSPEPITQSNSNSTQLDPITKFQKRQAQTEILNNHDGKTINSSDNSTA